MLCLKFPLLFVMVVSLAFAKPTDVDSTNDHNGGNGGTEPTHSQVLIIGAGPSGVAAASRLMENGVMNVTILEAETRIGGRTHTIPFGGHVLDKGAQWVHGAKGNVVYNMANPLGLLHDDGTSDVDHMRFLQSNGAADQDLLNHLFNISGPIRNDHDFVNHNGSVKDFFLKKFNHYTSDPANNITADPSVLNAFAEWMGRMYSFSDGEFWQIVSAKGFGYQRVCEGNLLIRWKNNGYNSVIDLLTKRYPNPDQELPVRRNTRLDSEVKTIHWGSKKVVRPTGEKAVLVETANGARYTGDIVLVTISLGVLKEHVNTMFDPPLPDRKLNAIQHIGFGTVDKLFLEFPEVWWPTDFTGYSIISSNEDRNRFEEMHPEYSSKGEWLSGLAGYFTVYRQPLLLYDWIVGEYAQNMEKYTDDEVKMGMVKWLEMFLNRTLPTPVGIVRSKWYSNPHFRGSYSYRSLDTENHDAHPRHLAEPLLGPDGNSEVLFAGEATSNDRYSTVDGAVETGWREADRILNVLGKQNRLFKSTSS